MWNKTLEVTPPEGEVLQTITASGMESELIFEHNLWWLPDRSMYVYYYPMFWKRMGA